MTLPVYPFPHLTAAEAGAIEAAMERARMENASDPERVALYQSLETAAAECRMGAERALLGDEEVPS